MPHASLKPAVKLIKMCIRDSTYAQYLLGKLTLMGEGVPKDPDAAYEWFAAARDNGHAYAEFFMKRMERGEQELSLIHIWTTMAPPPK